MEIDMNHNLKGAVNSEVITDLFILHKHFSEFTDAKRPESSFTYSNNGVYYVLKNDSLTISPIKVKSKQSENLFLEKSGFTINLSYLVIKEFVFNWRDVWNSFYHNIFMEKHTSLKYYRNSINYEDFPHLHGDRKKVIVEKSKQLKDIYFFMKEFKPNYFQKIIDSHILYTSIDGKPVYSRQWIPMGSTPKSYDHENLCVFYNTNRKSLIFSYSHDSSTTINLSDEAKPVYMEVIPHKSEILYNGEDSLMSHLIGQIENFSDIIVKKLKYDIESSSKDYFSRLNKL